MAVLITLPVDLTFVDRNDKVKYFTQGKERIFDRNRAILGRDGMGVFHTYFIKL